MGDETALQPVPDQPPARVAVPDVVSDPVAPAALTGLRAGGAPGNRFRPDQIVALQRTAGNAAVMRMLHRAKAAELPAPEDVELEESQSPLTEAPADGEPVAEREAEAIGTVEGAAAEGAAPADAEAQSEGAAAPREGAVPAEGGEPGAARPPAESAAPATPAADAGEAGAPAPPAGPASATPEHTGAPAPPAGPASATPEQTGAPAPATGSAPATPAADSTEPGAPAPSAGTAAADSEQTGVPLGPDGEPLVVAPPEISTSATVEHEPTNAGAGEPPPAASIVEEGAVAVEAIEQCAADAAEAAPPPGPEPELDSLPEPEAEAEVPEATAEPGDAPAVAEPESGTPLEEAHSRASDVGDSDVQFACPEDGDAEAEQERDTASQMVSGFLTSVGERAEQVADLGAAVPERYSGAASVAVDQIGAALEAQTQSVKERIGGLRAQTRARAEAASTTVASEHAAATATIESSTEATRETLQAELDSALEAIDAKETEQLLVVEAKYFAGVLDMRAVGRRVGDEAVALGEGLAAGYMVGVKNEDDNWLDGPLTYNKAVARADTAREISQAYRPCLIDEANAHAADAAQGVEDDREVVRATAAQAREALTASHTATLTTLADAEATALQQAEDARDQLTCAIAQALAGGEQTLDEQEVSLIRELRSAARCQAAGIEQQASELATATQDQISEAVTGLLDLGAELAAQAEGTEAPPLDELAAALDQAAAQLDGHVATIQGQIDQGLTGGEQQLAQAGQAVTDGLRDAAQTGLQSATGTAAEVQQAISSLGGSAGETFACIQDGHDTLLADAATSVIDGFLQTVTGVEETYAQHTSGIEERFEANAAALYDGLCGAKTDMVAKIREQAKVNADAVQPRWKGIVRVLAIVLIIAVTVLISLVTFGAGGILAGVIWGAVLGAASSGAIQLVDNWAYGRPAFDGFVKALAIGAIAGAISGGFGPWFAGLGKQGYAIAATGFRQFAAQVVVDVTAETVATIVIPGGQVTWESVGWSLLGAVLSGGAFALRDKLRDINALMSFADTGLGGPTSPGAPATTSGVPKTPTAGQLADGVPMTASQATNAATHTSVQAANAASHANVQAANAATHANAQATNAATHTSVQAANAAAHANVEAANAASHANAQATNAATHTSVQAANAASHTSAQAANAATHADVQAANAATHTNAQATDAATHTAAGSVGTRVSPNESPTAEAGRTGGGTTRDVLVPERNDGGGAGTVVDSPTPDSGAPQPSGVEPATQGEQARPGSAVGSTSDHAPQAPQAPVVADALATPFNHPDVAEASPVSGGEPPDATQTKDAPER